MVSTQHGSTRYRSETLGELVTLVEAAHAPGMWTNLTFDLSDPQRQRNVSVTPDLRRIEVRFYGADTTWVYGQDARLRELLRDEEQPAPSLIGGTGVAQARRGATGVRHLAGQHVLPDQPEPDGLCP
ncbi:hypothetical protein ACFVZL_12850 [Streptomyces sp. NPDC058320]|uniref:hypothetical protein n=1 Tax=unclassified Streptomyces TaxID=2593676 RepID=UPI0036442A66